MSARPLLAGALALLLAATTALAGWWTVPVVAALWGAARHRHRGTALDAGIAAALAWAALLARQALRGPVDLVATKVSAAMGLPGPALVLVALLYAFLLAWAAARLTSSTRRGPSRG